MLGLTPLGTVHTAISLIALIAGFGALWRYKEISTGTLSGQTFVGGTVLSCVTGLGIFQHGGFGNPHILAIVTLVVLAVALASGPDDPKTQPIIGFFFLLFLVGATLQVLRPKRIQPS
jgi:uncharacterized membrane protein